MEPRGKDRRRFKRDDDGDRRTPDKPGSDRDWGNFFAVSVGVGTGLGITVLLWVVSLLAPAFSG